MPRRLVAGLVGAFVALSAGASSSRAAPAGHDTSESRRPADAVRARNVILFIGDGMGDAEITLARNYARGAAGRLALDTLAATGACTTYAVRRGEPTAPVYVTDSAAAGTAWATGHKTFNGAIAVDPVTSAPLRTILELAKDAGFKTGNVTTAELTDATPAVLDAHVTSRSCQGPGDMASCPKETKEAGGLGSIAEQTIDHGVDVLMGGGRRRFDRTVPGGPFAGMTVTDHARAIGYQVVTDQPGLEAAASTGKLLGLFADGNMETEWTGPIASAYPGPPATRCAESNPARPETEPHLSAMTAVAIRRLDAAARADPDHGFFLQVEGASIDKADHARHPCAQIGETVELDRAVRVALDWATQHPGTLILVTADHGHTSQIVDVQTPVDHSPGAIATLITSDGQPMVVSYATNVGDRPQVHTGTQVRVAAQGPGAGAVGGVHDQTELFHVMARALGLE